MANDIQLEVVTPARAVLKERVSEVVLPGIEGDLGILPGHIPLLTALDIGQMTVNVDGKERTFCIDGGFAEISHHKVTVLTEGCEGADEIDIEHARQLLKDAEEHMSLLEERSKSEEIAEDTLVHHRKMLKRAQMRLITGEKN